MDIDYTAYSSEGFETTTEPEIIDVVSVEGEGETADEKVLMGTIDNCGRVYVRSDARKDANPLTDIEKGSEVLVTGTFDDYENNGWYKVCTAAGVEGYIMAKFVTLAD